MKIIFSLLTVSFVLFACSSEPDGELVTKPVEVKMPNQIEVEKVVVNPDKFASMEVEGMVCKMGCAAAIKAELLKTDAVAECNVEFIEEQKTNTVKFQYDSEKLDSAKVVELIQGINEGQFTIHEMSTGTL